MADLSPEELKDIETIKAFRKPHTLAKFVLEGKSEAVIEAFNAKKAEFTAAGVVDDGKDDEEPPAAVNEPDPDLILVTKDGEELMIHPDAEEDHKRLGWVRA